MTRYIDRDCLIIPSKYHAQIARFAVDIRGTLQRDDIYFRQTDLELLFGFALSVINKHRVVWIGMPTTRSQYFCYNELAAQYNEHQRELDRTNTKVFQFISIINTMLDDCESDMSAWSDTSSDTARSYSLIEHDESPSTSCGMVECSLNRKLLIQTIATKNCELQIKDRDITIATLQMSISMSEKNEIIASMQRHLNNANKRIADLENQLDDALSNQSEWV